MSSSGLEEALAKARDTLASGALTNEAQVRSAVITPILHALGWDPADTSQRLAEYPVDTKRVDEALLGPNGAPLVFVEAKRQRNLSVKAEDQLFGYANNKGVPLLVLTDGDTWHLYLSMAAGEPAERRFAHLTLTELDDLSRAAQDLREFIGREEVLSGRSDDAARARLQQNKSREIGNSGLESAWAELLREPDDMLCDLLIERVEENLGARPGTQDTEDFLRGQLMDWRPGTPTQGNSGQKSPPEAGNLRGFRIRGRSHDAASGRETLTLLASALERHTPGFLEAWAAFGRPDTERRRAVGSGDARLQDDVLKRGYRPVAEFPDWHLWVNGTTEKKLTWMRQMSELAGLRWGHDVEPVLDGPTG